MSSNNSQNGQRSREHSSSSSTNAIRKLGSSVDCEMQSERSPTEVNNNLKPQSASDKSEPQSYQCCDNKFGVSQSYDNESTPRHHEASLLALEESFSIACHEFSA